MERSSTRSDLIEAAARLLDVGGPTAVTLREVGRQAGVSHNAPYRHFADKDALLAAVAAEELVRRSNDVADASPSAKAVMLAYVRWALRHPERFRLTFGQWLRSYPDLDEAAAAARTRLVASVSRSQLSSELPTGDPERLSALLLALAHGAADLALAGHLAIDGKGRASAEMLVADLFDYLKPCLGRP